MEKGSKTWNKGRVWIQGAEKEVAEAYAEQSDKDLVEFLKCRKEEIVVGGVLFMLMGGRPSGLVTQVGDHDSSLKHLFTTLMDQAWQDLVEEVIRAHHDVMFLLYEPFFYVLCMELTKLVFFVWVFFGEFVKGFNRRGEKRWFQHSGVLEKHRGDSGCD